MQATETFFDIERHHIHLELTVFNNGVEYSVDAILDTGAPITFCCKWWNRPPLREPRGSSGGREPYSSGAGAASLCNQYF